MSYKESQALYCLRDRNSFLHIYLMEKALYFYWWKLSSWSTVSTGTEDPTLPSN